MSKYPAWTPEDTATLRALTREGLPPSEIARKLGRSLMAIAIRRQRDPECRSVLGLDEPYVPAWGKSPGRGKVYWTRERIIEGLRAYAKDHRGQLPESHGYTATKKGRPEYPTTEAVLKHFGTFAAAWEAAGAAKSRYRKTWTAWTDEENELLLDLAGRMTLELVAKRLNRTRGACRRQLFTLQAGRARDVPGLLSATEVAEQYGCPLHRVSTLIARGQLPAKRVQGGHYWRIDPAHCERIRHLLTAPKRTHRSSPPDTGNYDAKNGYRRITIAGRTVRVPATMGREYAERIAEREHQRWLLCHRLVRDLCPGKVARVNLEPGESPDSVRPQIATAARVQGFRVNTWYVGGRVYVELAAASQRDPYEVLGVRPDADLEIIEAAHRALAKRHHPDVGGVGR